MMLSQTIQTFVNMLGLDPLVVELMNGSVAVAAAAAAAEHQRSRPKRGVVVVAAAAAVSSNRPQTRSVVAAAAAAAAASVAPVSIETDVVATASVRPRTRAAVAAANAALAAAVVLANRPRTRAAVAATAAAADAALSLFAAETQPHRPTAQVKRRKNAKKTQKKKKTTPKKATPKTKQQATPPPQPALRSILRKTNFGEPRVNLKFVERGDINAERLGQWESALETCPSFPLDDSETQRLIEKNRKWRLKMMEDHPESSPDVMDAMDVFTFRPNLARRLIKDAADLEETDLLVNEIGELESFSTYERDDKVQEWNDQMAEFEATNGKKKVGKKRVMFEENE